MDGELAVVQVSPCIPHRVQVDLAGIERHRQRERLEGRAHLVDAGGQAIDAVGVVRFLRIVGIEVRKGDHRHDLAGLDVGDDAGGGLGVVLLLGLQEFVAQGVLDAQIDRELDRLLQPVGGKTCAVEIGQPLIVEPLLHAGDALVVDVDETDEVGDLVAGRIDALVLAQEADAGNAELVDVLLLLRRDLTLEPDEALARRQALANLDLVEVGHGGGQELDRLILVDDAARLPEQARRFDVGREDRAVAIDDVGPRGRDHLLRRGAARAVGVGADREHHEPAADQGVDRDEGEHRQADARACLCGAIDVAPIKQAADQPLPPPGLSRLCCRFGRGHSTHCLSSD
ncbi:hypothetical protein ACVWW5_002419 [Bradyrhizobium sp. LM3.4]